MASKTASNRLSVSEDVAYATITMLTIATRIITVTMLITMLITINILTTITIYTW